MARKRFESGDWLGYFTSEGRRKEVQMQLQFKSDNTVEGTGQDDFGFFRLSGVYQPTPPYKASFSRTAMEGGEATMNFEGFRESEAGGVFGTWKGSMGNGDFHFKPAKADPVVAKRMKEAARKTQIETLTAMGFPEYLCELALDECKNDLNASIEWISKQIEGAGGGGGEGLGIDTAIGDSTVGATEASSDALQQLKDMGFSQEQASYALEQTGNDVAAAIELLFSQGG
ncbi:ubiquitin C-terminal hydrolase Ubp14 [Balamuthia mandrillaris]